jgi:transposase
MPNPPAAALRLSPSQRSILESLAKSRTSPHRMVHNAKALLLAADGVANTEIAQRLDASRSSVIEWRRRFEDEGVTSIGKVRAGRGRKPSISQSRVEAIVDDTLHTKPEAETHWSTRSMARKQGVSSATVQRIWSAGGSSPISQTPSSSPTTPTSRTSSSMSSVSTSVRRTRPWCCAWTKRARSRLWTARSRACR